PGMWRAGRIGVPSAGRPNRAREPQGDGHSHEIGKCLDIELLHNVGTVNLHGDFTDSKFTPNLLVHHACSHENHHFLCALGAEIEVATQIVGDYLAVPALTIALKRNSNSIQKVLLA